MIDDESRPDPQVLLKKIQGETETSSTQGKLKIFFGFAAGVGKTYTMLKAAHKAKDEGRDVVVGYVERHTRPDTLALLDGLEILPTKQLEYKNIALTEFDLDAALARKPELILVDELAHSNAQGSRHLKRYQDIKELLNNGIDVYTTVNVQHLESLYDQVASITKVSVSERVPDEIFNMASQVELVDIEPSDLIKRLQEGKIYQKVQASRALDNFFNLDNLAALREIALRRCADRLNQHSIKQGKAAGSLVGEHILICLSDLPSNAKVIRSAARMAEAFHCGFTALLLENSRTEAMNEQERKRLRGNLHLAEQLGARVNTIYGEDPAEQIAEYAKSSGVTKIVLGRSTYQKRGWFGRQKALADRLPPLLENIDIYVIPDNQPVEKGRKALFRRNKKAFQFNGGDFIKMLLITAIATAISILFDSNGMREANVVIVYLVAVLITSILTQGIFYGVLCSVFSVLLFNYFFTDPRFTLMVNDPEYLITFAIMIIASMIASTLTTKVQEQANQAAQRAYYIELLLNASQHLQQGDNEKEILSIAAKLLSQLLNRSIVYAQTEATGQGALHFQGVNIEQDGDGENAVANMTIEERAVAKWVAKNNKQAGATTKTLAHVKNLYLAVRSMDTVMGVVGIPIGDKPLSFFEKNLVVALLNECGLVLERRRLSIENTRFAFERHLPKSKPHFLSSVKNRVNRIFHK
ncbi:sensor histidine kinase KdpD [Pasteurellaceae bacterium HPA106]|uniref:DUF4118 domain-containing protein n=1 Tax=Spirabiliibacterium pneumoniae TaxID=221400 RepID=UPI001AACE85D|nr:DUF4118 domain-containing protein [Spirabiliibacterium pneumoniae]MBE2896563.1 sensor histidine kinase KdpD [Spirabiliibacterium pneumoniae]